MKNTRLSFRVLFLPAAIACAFAAFSSGIYQKIQSPFNQEIEKDSLKKKFTQYHKNWPSERIFIQTDKPLYDPGETIWFSGFVVEESMLSLPGLSEILYVELLGPKGNVEKKLTLIARGGKANGDFFIGEDLPGGTYKIKACTRWMEQQNRFVERTVQVQQVVLPVFKLSLELDKKAYKPGQRVEASFGAVQTDNRPISAQEFEFSVEAGDKTLLSSKAQTDAEGKKLISFVLPEIAKGSKPVLNVSISAGGESESISRTIPVTEEEMLVYFFPEGGDFIADQNSKIAFKVLKADSTPADAEGWLLNGKGEKIRFVKSLHDGMGSFELKAKAGERYQIEWQNPVRQTSVLPDPLEKGYGLALSQDGNALGIRVHAPATDQLLLVAQMRGKWLWDKSLKAGPNATEVKVSAENWPSGVAVISLFDGRKLLRCERRVFVNAERRLKIALKTDKESYGTREKVNLSVRVSDSKGIPVPGSVLVSVANDALLSYADDKQSDILSALWLEQELNGRPENPEFYFSKDVKAKAALDLVMLTYGWRGIEWKKVMDYQGEKPGSRPEKATISGTIINSQTQKPNPGVKLEINGKVTYTDTAGKFRFAFVDLSRPASLRMTKGKEAPAEESIVQYGDDMLFYYPSFRVIYQRRDMIPVPMAAAEAMGAPEREGIKMLKRENAVLPAARAKGKAAALLKDEEKPLPGNIRRAFPVFPQPAQESPYYMARKFPNLPPAKTKERVDFSTTLFWSGIVDLDLNGRGNFSFYTKDDLSSYKATARAIGPEGLLGIGHTLFSTRLPFSVSGKIPVELTMGDRLVLPVMVKNKTSGNQKFGLKSTLSGGLKEEGSLPAEVVLGPGESKEILWPLKASEATDSCQIALILSTGQDQDIWKKSVRVVPGGYPVDLSFSGRELGKYFLADIKNMMPGSLKVHATAYPDVTSDLLAGVESILAEPFGCFEQTSMTSYPNVLVLNYLKQANVPDKELTQKAEALLEKGYKKLVSFETKQKGYEWFGGTPAHEALSAYGLLQFKEMQKVAPYVDASMVERTSQWLLSRRDGKGGFLRSAQALDNFGRANDEITNAYIVYSLAEAGFQQLDLEVQKTTETALARKDPYLLALASNTLWLLKQNEKAREVTRELLRLQAENGSWTGLSHSITYSTGEALTVETTSFALLALIRADDGPKAKIDKAVEFLCSQRQGRGGFGNSQATIMALKALTAYVVYAKTAAEDGAFLLKVNDKEAAKADWKAGTRKAISVGGWEKELKEGPNKLEFSYSILKDPLPFTVGIQYHTFLPVSDPVCKISLQTRLSMEKVKKGKPVQLEVNLKNNTADGLPMTMACLAIPAGCVVSPSELRELMDSKKVDFYEIRGNMLFLYFRQMGPSENKQILITLNAVLKGNYQSSASSAYLYYTAERKNWAKGLNLTVE